MNQTKQLWIGNTDLYFMLTVVQNWQVGSRYAEANHSGIQHALQSGLITYRDHYADAFPEGVQFFEVTDKGIDLVRRIHGDDAGDEIEEMRDWYRENTATPPHPAPNLQ